VKDVAVAGRPTDGARTLVVVTTAAWEATDAQLWVVRRDGEEWEPVAGPLPATVGKSGLRWGRGLHALPAEGLKQEGDGASPAGVFRMPGLVGTTSEAPGFALLPYQHAGPALRCVDDPASAAYNDLVEEPPGGPTWSSAEVMARPDGLYDLIVTVDHNGLDGQAVPGGGSCIFVHRWSQPGSPTVGCTALSAPDLAQVVALLEPPAVLVAAPLPVLERLASEWGAPWPLTPP
jgi:L,D-peptidoglycan transpeptidase YkuD (ErfK/YbiS/YcfS/YnhG family)